MPLAEPFKNWIHPGVVDHLAEDVARVYPSFDIDGFRSRARGLDRLELKARVTHVARALGHHLPEAWPHAASILQAILPSPLDREADFGENVRVWPLTEVVAELGLAHPEASLDLLGEMTRRWSSEFAIRPYIVRWPELTDNVLDCWVTHPDPHVRRLVSEGSRPRLPWGIRLQHATRSPERGLQRVLKLVDDPSAYVRRSVANHLGDVAKDHPALAVRAARGILEQPSDLRLQLARHGLRWLLKCGRPDALALFGQDAEVLVSNLRVGSTVAIGGRLPVSAWLTAAGGTQARIDLVWQWPTTRGWGSKTFRAGTVALPRSPYTFDHDFPIRSSSGRTIRSGAHRLTLRVNGRDQPVVDFTVV